jgi:hypothetical protein
MTWLVDGGWLGGVGLFRLPVLALAFSSHGF